MNSCIYVARPGDVQHKWIENTSMARHTAAEEGFIWQSVFEYAHIPEPDKPKPLSTGDLWIISEVPDAPRMALIAARVLLKNISAVHPDLDLSMLHYYATYNDFQDSGRILVRIPSSLFGGTHFCRLQPHYHRNMLNRFLGYTNHSQPLGLHDLSTDYRDNSLLAIGDAINPDRFLSAKPVLWLPPENCSSRRFTENHYTVEISADSFMEDGIDAIWRDVQSRYEWRLETKAPSGKPLEEVYLQAQYLPILSQHIEKNQEALSRCEAYQYILAHHDSLTDTQIRNALELFVPLGIAGYEKAKTLFPSCPKEILYESILANAYDRRVIPCAELKTCFPCSGECGVQNPYQLEEKQEMDDVILANYRLESDGLYYSKNGFADEEDTFKICSTFEIEASFCNADSTGWGKLALIYAPDGTVHHVQIPQKDCCGKGDSLITTLVHYGLMLTSNAYAKYIRQYFIAYRPAKLVHLSDKLGWHGDCYVFPEQNIGYAQKGIIYSRSPDKFQESCTLTEWQEHVGRYCVGNSLLMLLVAYALTGPLLRPLDQDGGGLHLYGPSSVGKTTQAHVAGSVCGGTKNRGYINQWRTTANALERTAASHNDSLLILDELGESTSEDVSASSYMLANGQGKERMRADSAPRSTFSWRLNFLSTGELPVADKIRESGKRRVMAGQEVRMVDIPILACGTNAVFENLHGLSSGAQFSNILKANATRYFGSPIRVFVKALCGETRDDLDRNVAEIESSMESFINAHCPAGSSGQVQRVASRFALIAAAGEFACKHDILPWSVADARAVAAKWFRIWLRERGTLGSKEIENAISNIIEHWNRNWETSYMDLDVTENRRFNREVCGYYWLDKKTGETVVLVKSEVFSDLTKRANRKELMAELGRRGLTALNENANPLETRWISSENRNVRGVGLIPSRWEGKIAAEDKAKDTGGNEQTSDKVFDPYDPIPGNCFW